MTAISDGYLYDDDSLVTAFLGTLRNQGTVDQYSRSLRRFRDWCTTRQLRLLEVDVIDAERFVKALPELLPHISESTRAATISGIGSFYTYLLNQGVIGASPFRTISIPAQKPPAVTILSREQMAALLATASHVGPRATVIFTLALFNGLNLHEICDARVEDLTHLESFAALRLPKREIPTITPLAPLTAEAIRADVGSRKTGPLIMSQRGGHLARHSLLKNIARWGRLAGIPDLTHRLLRTTMIGTALELGVDELAIARAVGRADTRRLARLHKPSTETSRHPAIRIAQWMEGGGTENELLDQADRLLVEHDIHPVAPVVVGSAVLEARLRELTRSHGLTVADQAKAGMMEYANALKAKGVIKTRQWRQIEVLADMRNETAHGRNLVDLTIADARRFVSDVRDMWNLLGTQF